MLIETTVKLTVYPNEDYFYEVTMGETFSVSYREPDRTFGLADISFGSIEEMEAVAKAMLKACEIYKVK